ncbi:ATP-binding protein [Rhodovulum steppense]|uniref:ATPase family protein associated with various cellular activities (AAA) n=1 Tax=Rhodovulum steppense TaxID=540251 RepID=A0A4R1YVR3_9RHOB|nr:ATP-binding protein [Rhodovulum steppense]TCM85036.1 ATPase family protein associated with various cellular activities (AAA) [Rhodovulum steppense]
MSAEPRITAAETATQAMRAALARHCDALAARIAAPTSPGPLPRDGTAGSALETLALRFGLTPIEADLMALAAGPDLHAGLAEAIAAATGGVRADLSLALAVLGPEAWTALCPAAPLRRHLLLTLDGTGPMLRRTLAADERAVQFLMGLGYLDPRLAAHVRPVPAPDAPPTGAARDSAATIARAWDMPGPLPVLLLAGPDPTATRAAMATAAAALGLALFRIGAADLPADPAERHALARLIDRELAFSDGALLIEAAAESAEAARALADLLHGPTAIAAPDPEPPERAPRLRIETPAPDSTERRAVWQATLGSAHAAALGPALDHLAGQFALDRAGIAAAADMLPPGTPPDRLAPALWQAARVQGRRRLDGLAQRIDSRATWDDLVLPAPLIAQIKDLAAHVRQCWQVSDQWGWREKSPRGLGSAALFAGASGTGKTLAAEVIAGELALDLYRIDLSQVVSKYIGETEKNLSRVFAAAEASGAILLFDEADALFGKRSEVRDSHDRYANIEVSYLLQRMESYPGLAILTTNQKSALDAAFLRRLRFVVTFPFPDAAARAAIWARIFPAATPTSGLDPARLARLNLAGGAIRSVALNASYLAADTGGPVTMAHVLAAAEREYAKLEKPFTAAERRALE